MEAVAPTVAMSVGSAADIAKYSATTAAPVVAPTVARAVGVAAEIARCRATAVFERTGFNSVLLSMTAVPIPGGCAKTVCRG